MTKLHIKYKFSVSHNCLLVPTILLFYCKTTCSVIMLSLTAVSLPCTEDVPTCGGTCDKPLACGRHKCTQQCHTGSCGICRQFVTKTCRCSKREKDVLCSQEFLCESKCLKMRQCERHACKRKVGFTVYLCSILAIN